MFICLMFSSAVLHLIVFGHKNASFMNSPLRCGPIYCCLANLQRRNSVILIGKCMHKAEVLHY